jgi:hypothetical protein
LEGFFDGRSIDRAGRLRSYLLLLAIDTSIGAALIGNKYGYD